MLGTKSWKRDNRTIERNVREKSVSYERFDKKLGKRTVVLHTGKECICRNEELWLKEGAQFTSLRAAQFRRGRSFNKP